MKHQNILDGSTAARAVPPVHVKGLLEEAGLDPDVSNKRCAELYAKACRDYLEGKLPGQDSWSTWQSIVTQIGKIGGIK